MHDIYHALINFEISKLPDDHLKDYSVICSDASHAITCALRLIGNLTIEANASEDYTGEDAKRDLYLMGAVLRNLPRMSEALIQNSEIADNELRKRKEVRK
ncbi:TPA: hypothetical protein ACKPVP_002313 [Serratia marcescens]